MILLNEMRQGNYIMPNNERFVKSYNKKPTKFEKSRNYYLIHEDDKNGIYTKDYDPIPITRDLLLKIGFILSVENECYAHYKTENQFYISLAKQTDDFVKENCWYCEHFNEITSLHWLQNYYFFNHKTELIKNEPKW